MNLSLIAGTLLLPYAIEQDKFYIVDPNLYASSVNMSIVFAIITSSFVALPILILDMTLKNKLNFPVTLKINSFFQRLETIPAVKAFSVLLVSTLIGSSLIWYVFMQTGNIPYINVNESAKYFYGFTEQYIPLRPLYVLGQQILAVSGLISIIYIMQAASVKKSFLFISLLSFSTLILLLTLKRGEIFYPFTTLIGGLVLSQKINKRNMISLILIVSIISYIAMLIDPGNINKPFANKLRNISRLNSLAPETPLPNIAEISDTEAFRISNKQFLKFLTSAFGVKVRESARLIYNFRLKNLSFLYGRTFLAGIVGFIPTEYFKFKEKYQIGRITLGIFGINKETSGGPRIGLHGEGYINFGISGVLILPAILGAFIWFLDKFYISTLNTSTGKGIFLMTTLFFITQHLVLGLFSDGSGAIQTFIIRTAIITAILSSLMFIACHRKQKECN